MRTVVPLQALAAKPRLLGNSSHAGLVLQRKCACGSPTAALTGECEECTSKKRLQTKLTIGASNDPLEQEADRVADQVLAAPAQPAVNGALPRIQRFVGQAAEGVGTAPASVEHVFASPGRPLDPALRQDMEQRFGHDFSRVRVHTDGAAAQSAQEINANAYTVGQNIVFGAGRFALGSHEGRRLFAHELVHVIQQRLNSPMWLGSVVEQSDLREPDARRILPAMTVGSTLGWVERSPSLHIQRQEAEAEPLASSPGAAWVMLKPPPVVQQQSLTCWAAALSSWLGALGSVSVTFQEIILRYAGKSCIEPDNSLSYATAREVYAEWGAEFTNFATAEVLTGAKVRQLLHIHGHLLFAQVGSTLGHVLVVYGSGFDEKGQLNPDYISVMDPLSGKHENRPLGGLGYPVEVGRAGKSIRPAHCMSKPGKVPPP